MAESAALLIDEVLPREPMRQWVLSVPFPLRFLFASQPKVMGKALGIVYRTIATHLTRKAGYTKSTAHAGAVTPIQRFGGALNLNIHLICLASFELAPGSSETVIRINRAYRLAGKNATGIKVLQDWLNDNQDNLAVPFELARSYLADGKQDAAIGEYEKILDKQPENAAALNGLAWLYHEKGKPGALVMARKASKLAPDNPAIQDTYGWILVQSGGATSGLAALEYAASKLPNNREVQYHLAYALVETGQVDKARVILNEILKNGKPFGDRDKAEALLGKLK